jgi:hypothetical protein
MANCRISMTTATNPLIPNKLGIEVNCGIIDINIFLS